MADVTDEDNGIIKEVGRLESTMDISQKRFNQTILLRAAIWEAGTARIRSMGTHNCILAIKLSL